MKQAYLIVAAVCGLASSLFSETEKSGPQQVQRTPDLRRTAQMLERETGMVWREVKDGQLGIGPYLVAPFQRADRDRAFYWLMPFPLDEAGKAKLIVFASNCSFLPEVVGAGDQFTLLTCEPGDDNVDRQLNIMAVLGLEKPKFKLAWRPNDPEAPVNLDAFRLDISHYGESDKPKAGLTLSVAPFAEGKPSDNWQSVRITKDEAKAILDALSANGAFGACSARLAGHSPSDLSGRSLLIVMRGSIARVDFFSDLDARQPKDRQKAIDALRQSLKGDAAKALALLESRAATTSPSK